MRNWLKYGITGIAVFICRNRVVEDMRNLDRMKDEYAGIQIPVSVLK